jgi:hypothetical protein
VSRSRQQHRSVCRDHARLFQPMHKVLGVVIRGGT